MMQYDVAIVTSHGDVCVDFPTSPPPWHPYTAKPQQVMECDVLGVAVESRRFVQKLNVFISLIRRLIGRRSGLIVWGDVADVVGWEGLLHD